MKKRSRAGGEPIKGRRRTAVKTTRRNVSAIASSSDATKDAEIARLSRELNEALERQAATSEVLEVISGSPGDLQPVFAAMLENAVRICDATFGVIYRWDGEFLHALASHKTPPALAEARRRSPIRPRSDMVRTVTTKSVVHIPDLAAHAAYTKDRDPALVSAVELGGVRTFLVVPMFKGTEFIGSFSLYRQEVRPFTDKQIALVTNFVAQAGIAIENARLLNELRQSLQQQTATADVLKVISRSTFDLQTVLNTLVQSAAELCEADKGSLERQVDPAFELIASYGFSIDIQDFRRFHAIDIGRGTIVGRTILDGRPVQVQDVQADPDYTFKEAARIGNVRTALGVPLLREGSPIGVFFLCRATVRPFTEKQIDLVTTFADQAVIAIENARLLNELRQRTDDLTERTADLTEALEQQTATSDVLQLISRSPGDLEPVFASMLENAVRICDAKFAIMNFPEPGGVRPVAMHNVPEAFAELRQRVVHFGPKHPLTHVAATKEMVHIPDLELYADEDAVIAKFRELTDARTILHVPMLKDEELVGIVSIYRQEVRPFTDKQVDLVKSFAAQAVIAIENTRPLNELRQSLQQQSATADVLKVISRSTFDLQSVLDTLVGSVAQLCGADMVGIAEQSDSNWRQAASYGFSSDYQEVMARTPIPSGRGSISGRVVLEGRAVQIPDVEADREYELKKAVKVGGVSTILGVPLLREGSPIGVMVLERRVKLPFTDTQIELAETFADQAVIAIENGGCLTNCASALRTSPSAPPT